MNNKHPQGGRGQYQPETVDSIKLLEIDFNPFYYSCDDFPTVAGFDIVNRYINCSVLALSVDESCQNFTRVIYHDVGNLDTGVMLSH